MRLLTLLTLLFFSLACGTAFPDNPYFPSQQATHADFVADGTGLFTHIQLIPMSDHRIDMHITKDDPRAYWYPGQAQAQVHWIMQKQLTGQWRAVQSINYWADTGTIWRYKPLNAYSYQVVAPADFKDGEYIGKTQGFISTLDGILQQALGVTWISRMSHTEVITPAYSGPAMLNEEHECNDPVISINDPTRCAIEKWYFAPGIGLVQIDDLWQGGTIRRVK